MTNCKKCNQEVPEDARFCPNCGSEVQTSTSPTEAQPYRYNPETDDSETSVPQSTGHQLSRDSRNIAMLIHLSAFAGLIFPFGNIIGPLVIWLLKREDSPFIDFHGKSALNFQISLMIYTIISAILILLFIGIFLLIAIIILGFILVIVAAVRANDGSEYTYPLAIRFLK